MLPGAYVKRPPGGTIVRPYLGRPIINAAPTYPLPSRVSTPKSSSSSSTLKLALAIAGFLIILGRLQNPSKPSKSASKPTSLEANPFLSVPSDSKRLEAVDFLPSSESSQSNNQFKFFNFFIFQPESTESGIDENIGKISDLKSLSTTNPFLSETSKAKSSLFKKLSQPWKMFGFPSVSDFQPEFTESSINENISKIPDTQSLNIANPFLSETSKPKSSLLKKLYQPWKLLDSHSTCDFQPDLPKIDNRKNIKQTLTYFGGEALALLTLGGVGIIKHRGSKKPPHSPNNHQEPPGSPPAFPLVDEEGELIIYRQPTVTDITEPANQRGDGGIADTSTPRQRTVAFADTAEVIEIEPERANSGNPYGPRRNTTRSN